MWRNVARGLVVALGQGLDKLVAGKTSAAACATPPQQLLNRTEDFPIALAVSQDDCRLSRQRLPGLGVSARMPP